MPLSIAGTIYILYKCIHPSSFNRNRMLNSPEGSWLGKKLIMCVLESEIEVAKRHKM